MDLIELKQIIAKGEAGRHQFKEDIRSVDSLAAEIIERGAFLLPLLRECMPP